MFYVESVTVEDDAFCSYWSPLARRHYIVVNDKDYLSLTGYTPVAHEAHYVNALNIANGLNSLDDVVFDKYTVSKCGKAGGFVIKLKLMKLFRIEVGRCANLSECIDIFKLLSNKEHTANVGKKDAR